VCNWHPISNAPFDEDLKLSVIERSEVHALVFPCRRTPRGWINAMTKATVLVTPTHWRPWPGKATTDLRNHERPASRN
jgi:hypothetical protein